MSWDRLVDTAQRTLTRLFASDRTITYTSSQGLGAVDLTGRALFRGADPRTITLSTGEPEVQAEMPTLGVDLAELPGGVTHHGDTVVVSGADGGTFAVVRKLGDGEGTATLELEAA